MPPLDEPHFKREAALHSPQLRQRSVRQKLQQHQHHVESDGHPTPAGSFGDGPLSSAAGRAPRASVWREDMSAAAAALLCIGNSASSSQARALAPASAAAQPAATSQRRSASTSEASGSGASESSTFVAAPAVKPKRRTARAGKALENQKRRTGIICTRSRAI